ILNIKTELTIESVEVINILGKNVLTISKDQMTNNTVNLSELRNGIYFVNISAEGKKQTIKVVKE
ncbi:MAG: T9SS type A sorting domain-containing protein, partial [Psychroserpens sp.]|nr:T9SS type A sorting domain-containing protein [Psychroserpens sp.]